jgi:hypothetical protein
MIYECCGIDENGNEPKDYDEEAIEESLDKLRTTYDFEDFCDDCDTCCLNKMCETQSDCIDMFDKVKSKNILFDAFVDEVRESYGY